MPQTTIISKKIFHPPVWTSYDAGKQTGLKNKKPDTERRTAMRNPSIRIGPKYGVNPTIPIYLYCGQEKTRLPSWDASRRDS